MDFARRLESRAQSASGHGGVHSDLKAGRERTAFTQSIPYAGEAGFQCLNNRGHGVTVSDDLGEATGQIAHLHWNEDRRHK